MTLNDHSSINNSISGRSIRSDIHNSPSGDVLALLGVDPTQNPLETSEPISPVNLTQLVEENTIHDRGLGIVTCQICSYQTGDLILLLMSSCNNHNILSNLISPIIVILSLHCSHQNIRCTYCHPSPLHPLPLF